MSQNRDKRQVLDLIKKYFECGFIRPDYANKTLKFEVRNNQDLINKIIPHFEKFSLISKKHNDFIMFKDICEMVSKKKHLSPEGFIEILKIAYRMNKSGVRKRPIQEIIKSILIKMKI